MSFTWTSVKLLIRYTPKADKEVGKIWNQRKSTQLDKGFPIRKTTKSLYQGIKLHLDRHCIRSSSRKCPGDYPFSSVYKRFTRSH